MKPITPIDASNGRFTRRGWNTILALGCALVLSLFVSSFWQADASLKALSELQLQAQRTGRLDSLLIQLVDAENGARGYLLGRNSSYLEPYLNSLATIEYTLEDIRDDVDIVRDNQDALVQLTGLITLKLQILSDALARARRGPSAPPRVEGADGRRYMDSIRKTLAEMKSRTVAHGQRSFEASIAHVERMRWVVATLSAGALVLLIALFIVLRRQLALREQIADLLQQENLRLDSLVRARTSELSNLASYLTNTREAEQARLARELHDELGALLTAAKMDAAWVARQLDPPALAPHRERFERLLTTLDSGIALKRRIIDDLRPPLLQDLGLVAALRTLGEEFARSSDVRVTLDLPDTDLDLPPESSLALFRIAQESLTNIRRHAQARTVRLSLELSREHMILRVEDDGVGFDASHTQHRRHGLAGMRHRVQMFFGEFAIDSRPGAGTRVTATLPLAAVVQGAPSAGASH